MVKIDKYNICTKLWKELKKFNSTNILISLDKDGITVNFCTRFKLIRVKVTDEEMKTLRMPEIVRLVVGRFRRELYEDRKQERMTYGMGI